MVAILASMTTGFAIFGRILELNGTVGLAAPGEVGITNVARISGTNIDNTLQPTWQPQSVDFNLKFLQNSGNASFRITVENHSFTDYTFALPDWTPTIYALQNNVHVAIAPESLNYTVAGVSEGETLPINGSKIFTVNINFSTTEYAGYTFIVDNDYFIELDTTNTGNLLCSVQPTTANLSGNTTESSININVVNSYTVGKSFTVSVVDSSKFRLLNPNNSATSSFNINAGATTAFPVKLQRIPGALFNSNLAYATVFIRPANGGNIKCGSISVTVTQNTANQDSTAPIISKVYAYRGNTDGLVNLNWMATDDSTITNFTILVYRVVNGNRSLVKTLTAPGSSNSLAITGLTDGTYTFLVYGKDVAGNTATQAQINAATTAPGPAALSPQDMFNWLYQVTHNLSGLTGSGGNTVRHGANYSSTLKPTSNRYSAPPSIEVTMEGTTLPPSRYTYTVTNYIGYFSIQNVTGNLTITATSVGGSCLLEGTIVRLANGTEKPIESIGYNDKLLVWNHETDTTDAADPIWIEKAGTAYSYQKITFSDGSTLGVVGDHGIFSVDLNRYVDVSNPDEFKEGMIVYKVVNNDAVPVTVTKIEHIKQRVHYYHVMSVKYHNIISNGFVTTDGKVALGNPYGFEGKMKWPAIREQLIKDPNNLYDYSAFNDIIPREWFDGFRLAEAKILSEYLSLEEVREFLIMNANNQAMWLQP